MVRLLVAFMIPANEAKRPSDKTMARKSFVRRLSDSFQMKGMGRSASKKSVAMVTAALL